MDCVGCKASLRDGAAFCGACGARQPAPLETPAAVTRYREVVTRFVAEGGLDEAKRDQLETLRVHLGVSLSTHASLVGQLEPAVAPPPSIRLSIDVTTLEHLAVGARGLVRWRIENEGPLALDTVQLSTTLSGESLPVAQSVTLFPGRATVLNVVVTPAVTGFHELAGELRLVDLMGEARRYKFADIHVRAGSAGPQVQVVNIDQSSARVVDNSRSTFGASQTGGVLGEGDWQPIALRDVTEPRVASAAANPRRVEFAVTTEKATYQVTSTIAQGDIATVFGGHVRGSQPPQQVALKIADQTSDNDLLQHEVRVLGLLLAEPEAKPGPRIHLPAPRDQFRTGDGRLGTVFDHLDGFDLTAVRDRCRKRGEPGLAPKHLIWILRRSLAALGFAHTQGILHGNVDPAHILVRPHDHMLWLVDWCWAIVNPAQTGQSFKAANELYSPPEVKDHGRPTPASDLYALGKCAIHLLGGDPESKTLPPDADIDPKLARFLRYLTVESQGGRPQDAWELYLQVERMRQQIWGEHVFVPLEL